MAGILLWGSYRHQSRTTLENLFVPNSKYPHLTVLLLCNFFRDNNDSKLIGGWLVITS